VLACTLEVSCHELWSAWRRSARGELHRNSGLIIILSQGKVSKPSQERGLINLPESAGTSVEQIVPSLGDVMSPTVAYSGGSLTGVLLPMGAVP
jgi:hypothetical protein